MALRVLIVDDEPLGRDCVRLALEGEDDLRISESSGGMEAIEAIEKDAPDVVFLDVQMPDVSGFDVLEAVGPERMPPVVFVTAYDRHAVRAFEVRALDFVLKPFSDARIREALGRARARLRQGRERELRARLERLLADLGRGRTGREGYASRLMVKNGDRIRFVSTSEIDWIEADGNYVRVHTGGDVHRIRSTLTGMLERLEPSAFVRIHRSTIVRVDRVAEVQPWFGGDYIAILACGEKLRVSRRYREELLRPIA